jgi:hypothetical protein
VADLARFEGDGGIALTVDALGALLSNTEIPAPGSVIADSEKKNGVVRGLGCGRPGGGFLGRCLRLSLRKSSGEEK